MPQSVALISRPYRGLDDLRAMLALLKDGRSVAGDWRYWHTGELAFAFFLIARHLDPRRQVRLWHEAGGRLAGYATVGEDPVFDFQVAPGFEGRGIEEQALAWAEERIAALRLLPGGNEWGPLSTSARVDDGIRIATLERLGFTRAEDVGTYTEVNYLRALEEPIPDPVLPAGFRILGADEAPLPAERAAAQAAVWGQWACGRISAADYAWLQTMPGYDPALDVAVLAPDGSVTAYVNGWADAVNRIGDFGPVGAVETYRRRGLTRAVLLECLRRMRARGLTRVCVSTGENNTAARGLYESVGFVAANRTQEWVR
ncbi:MAG: GNAT family N-acetyltransferase [Anaerolineae bacterium]